MVTAQRTFDYEMVRQVMTHPRIFKHLCDDGSASIEDFRVIEHDAIVYVVVHDEGELLGVFMLHPHNMVCYEVHTCLLPSAWGEKAKLAGKSCREWMFENTKCRRIITNVPSYNRLAAKFSEDCGMVKFGVNGKSIQKNGVLHDQYMYGICKD